MTSKLYYLYVLFKIKFEYKKFNFLFRYALKFLREFFFDVEINNQELKNLKELNHENIIKYVDQLFYIKKIGIITQYYNVRYRP